MSRGRKPPKHEPVLCAGCGRDDKPVLRDGRPKCRHCGSDYHFELIRRR